MEGAERYVDRGRGPLGRDEGLVVAGVELRTCEAMGVEMAPRTPTTQHLRRSRARRTPTTPAGPAQRRTTVCSRSGPTPTAQNGAPDMSSRARTYACALGGRSSKVRQPEMSATQP